MDPREPETTECVASDQPERGADWHDEQLLTAYQAGEEWAAAVLFDRYYHRLVQLMLQQRGRPCDRIEAPSDIVMSVFGSLFQESREKKIDASGEKGLWPYLVTIALNKVRGRVQFWNRQKRSQDREVPFDAGSDPLEHGPAPSDLAAVDEIIAVLLAQFSERRRKIIEMMLDGYSVKEIADAVGSSLRTVFNTRKAAEGVLRQLMELENG